MNTILNPKQQTLVEKPFAEMSLIEKHEMHKQARLQQLAQESAEKKALHNLNERNKLKKAIQETKAADKRMGHKIKTVYKSVAI